MEVSVKSQKNTKPDIELPSTIKNIQRKTQNIEILPNNVYLSEQKPFSAPISSSPPNDFMNILKKRMNNYF
jgi:hypothetical protein